jgi:hypothetical protein
MENISRIPIVMSIQNIGQFKGELIRFLSPLTIKKLVYEFPITQRVINYENKYIYLNSNLTVGIEKPKNSFKKGDIAYSPLNNSIYLFLQNLNHNQKFNHLGILNIDKNIEIKSGSIITIDKY